MDYELISQKANTPPTITTDQMHVLLADFTGKAFTEVQPVVSELVATRSLWNWVIIEPQQHSSIVDYAAQKFAITSITLSEDLPEKSTYPKIVRSIVAQQESSTQTKLILLIINNHSHRQKIKERFIRNASRQLRARFIDLRLAEQDHTPIELELLKLSYSILLKDSADNQSPIAHTTRTFHSRIDSLKALLNLIISIGSAVESQHSKFFYSAENGVNWGDIFDDLSKHAKSNIRVYKESYVAKVVKSLAEKNNIASAKDLLTRLPFDTSLKDAFIDQLYSIVPLRKAHLSRLRETLLQAAPQIKLWSKGNNGELRVWIPNFRNYLFVKEIALLIKSTLNEIDDRIVLKLFASDHDMSRMSSAQKSKAYDTSTLGCHIILAHHDLLRQAPFSSIHILFLFKFMSNLNLSYANRLYSMYHFAMISGGLLLSEEPLTDEATRYFSKPGPSAHYYVNIQKSRGIQYPQFGLAHRRPVKMALAPPSLKKLTSVMDKQYQVALLNKLLAQKELSLLVIDDEFQVTHFYGNDENFINPYRAGHFCFSLERLLGEHYSKQIRESIDFLDEQDSHKITIRAAEQSNEKHYTLEIGVLAHSSSLAPARLHNDSDQKSYYSLKISQSELYAEKSYAYNHLLGDKIRRLETRVEAVNQKLAANNQWLTVAKGQLLEIREKLTQTVDEHHQLRSQFGDIAKELAKLNDTHAKVLDSLTIDAEFKENLILSVGVGIIYCDFNQNRFLGLGHLTPIFDSKSKSKSLKRELVTRLPNILNCAKLSAEDGVKRIKSVFIRGRHYHFTLSPMTDITQKYQPSKPYHRVAMIIQDIHHQYQSL